MAQAPLTRPPPREDREGDSSRLSVAAVADLPTKFGLFRVHVFSNGKDGAEHLAIVKGDVRDSRSVPVRLHSECLTGDVLGSLRCDCGEQLQRALAIVGQEPAGLVLYLRQEGRGIGLTNKIRAYGLQTDLGLDTVDANRALGFRDDERDYGVAASMLRTLDVQSVRLLTNNPEKVRQLRRLGIPVDERIPHVMRPCDQNRSYLETKARRFGHLLDDDATKTTESKP